MLEELLRNTNARISLDFKWLVSNDDKLNWTVYTRKYHAKYNTVLYSGNDLSLAIKVLQSEGQNDNKSW